MVDNLQAVCVTPVIYASVSGLGESAVTPVKVVKFAGDPSGHGSGRLGWKLRGGRCRERGQRARPWPRPTCSGVAVATRRFCSSKPAPMSRTIEASLGWIPTTSVRRLTFFVEALERVLCGELGPTGAELVGDLPLSLMGSRLIGLQRDRARGLGPRDPKEKNRLPRPVTCATAPLSREARTVARGGA